MLVPHTHQHRVLGALQGGTGLSAPLLLGSPGNESTWITCRTRLSAPLLLGASQFRFEM